MVIQFHGKIDGIVPKWVWICLLYTSNLFPLYLGDEPMYHTVSIAYNKDRHLPIYARKFMELVEMHFKAIEKQRIHRL